MRSTGTWATVRRFAIAGEAWSHEVMVGTLAEAAEAIRTLAPRRPLPLVSDHNLLALYGETVGALLDVVPITIPAGEAAKDWATLQLLVQAFSDMALTRDTPVLALGGGSVLDVGGLASALFKRGCPVVNIPTTLLAQVDAAVGGKTAIHACGQKNLVGTFHTPSLVVCDPAFLRTLDPRQLRAGYAEVMKYGLIDDRFFFDWCEKNGQRLLDGDERLRTEAVEHCLQSKARLIGADLHDRDGGRALLNLGHSFAHAIEALNGFGAVLHGEAVAVGLCLAFDFSHRLGLCPANDAARVRAHVEQVGLPARLSDVGVSGRASELLALIRKDKKAASGQLVLVLAHGIGRAFLARDVDEGALADFLQSAG